MSQAENTEIVPYVDEQDSKITDGWRVTELGSMDWALSRVAELEQEIAENEEMVATAIAMLEARLQKLNEKAFRGVKFFRACIQDFANSNKDLLLKGGKKKSRDLPHGKIGWRRKGGGLKVTDPEALLAWAQKQEVEFGFVRIKEEPSLSTIKKYAEEKGLIPPGMEEEPAIEEFHCEALSMALAKKEH